MRPNRNPHQRLRAKNAARRLLLESLEPRHVMHAIGTGAVADTGHVFDDFHGNYYPAQHSQEAQTDFLSGAQAGSPLAVAQSYLQANASAFGLTGQDVMNALATNNYADTGTGVAHVYLQQYYNG